MHVCPASSSSSSSRYSPSDRREILLRLWFFPASIPLYPRRTRPLTRAETCKQSSKPAPPWWFLVGLPDLGSGRVAATSPASPLAINCYIIRGARCYYVCTNKSCNQITSKTPILQIGRLTNEIHLESKPDQSSLIGWFCLLPPEPFRRL